MSAPVLDSVVVSDSNPQDGETVDVSLSGHDPDARTVRLRGQALANSEGSNFLYTDITVGVELSYELVEVDVMSNEPLANPTVEITPDVVNPGVFHVTV